MNNILETKEFVKYFPSLKGEVRAVDRVDIEVKEGETFGVVGESGCGKTTLGKTILRLIEPTSGKIFFKGNDITDLEHKELRKLRKEMNIVFQDPSASLNPQMTVSDHLRRPLEIHNIAEGDEKIKRIIQILNTMGLKAEHMIRYPHELSGGQKQRVCIARALCVEPDFLVLDEPTSALDVSVQSKILKLLERAKRRFNLSYMFISHNINLVRAISDRIAVMYLGRIVEIGETEDLFNDPQHPYTKALFRSVPKPDPDEKVEEPLKGEVPSPVNPPKGCHFSPRCKEKVGKICEEKDPQLEDIDGRKVACHLYR